MLRSSVISRWMPALAALFTASGAAQAQPFNVRAWYAEGQVFVIWQFPAPPAVATDTVEIYTSPAAQATTANMTRVGRLFFPEYTGGRLDALNPGARLLVPTPGGGTYRLAMNEGCFALTPHQAGNLFFAVVDSGANVVVPGNSAATPFLYDPVNDPVRPHEQFGGTTAGGNPYTAYVLWADGRADYDDSRPDFPVMASRRKNGVPHVFTITRPDAGSPPPPPQISCLFALHGGEGEYQLFRPGIPARANMSLELDDGIVVTPDDSLFLATQTGLERTGTSWFGYTPDFDPFTNLPRPLPPDTAVVVNFTQRRVDWIYDWLLGPNSGYTIDPNRVAIVGHSAGGRGTSHLSRLHPERYCAAVCYTPASDLTVDDPRDNFIRGNWDQNLATNLVGPAGVLGVTDVFTMTTRLSATERDFTLTRVFNGKRDEKSSAAWSETQRAVFDSLNDSRMGFMQFWDEREHGVELWNTETSDATDGHAGPWPDVGQWVWPVRTYRSSGEYLLNTYRTNQSFPGFFNAFLLDPGSGDPDVGDTWGTWGGYFDWDTSTIVDQLNTWACTLFAVNGSVQSIDDCPVAEITTDLAPRRTQLFNPAPGTHLVWTARDLDTGAILQVGNTTAEADGLAVVTGLVVPRDPVRVRLTIRSLGKTSFTGPTDSLVIFGVE